MRSPERSLFSSVTKVLIILFRHVHNRCVIPDSHIVRHGTGFDRVSDRRNKISTWHLREKTLK
jgi:hypothetical protein